jgi:chromosome partitioning protein
MAEWFSRKGLRILALDLDPQCNLSRRFIQMDLDPTDPQGIMPPIFPDYDPTNPDENPTWDGRSSSAAIFTGTLVVPYPTGLPGLDILPGHAALLDEVERVRKEHVQERVHTCLRTWLAFPQVQEHYDLVLIDTMPSKGPLTISAVRAATHIIIPTEMEQQSIEGLVSMLQLWKRENFARATGEEVELIGILPNKMRKGVSLHEGFYESLMADPAIRPYMLPLQLHQRVGFAEQDVPTAQPRCVFDRSASDEVRREAEAVCKYIEARVFA